jgi:hypothetical protein
MGLDFENLYGRDTIGNTAAKVSLAVAEGQSLAQSHLAWLLDLLSA